MGFDALYVSPGCPDGFNVRGRAAPDWCPRRDWVRVGDGVRAPLDLVAAHPSRRITFTTYALSRACFPRWTLKTGSSQDFGAIVA